jgi:hypothetical protein
VGTPTRVVFFSPEQAVALHSDRARALFAWCRAKSLAAAVGDGDPMELARALWARPVPTVLAGALDQLARFGTQTGRDALVEAAHDMSRDTAGWDDEGPVDLAARLLVDPPSLAGLFARAQLRLARLPPARPTYELRAKQPRPARSTVAIAESLRAMAEGPWGEAWVHEDDEGTLHAVLLYAAPVDDACEVDPRSRAPVRGPRRVLRADTFRFLAGDARLLVTTARPMLLDAYAAAWGRALAGDERFFLDAASLTLKPLQALGSRGLAAARLPRGLARAAVIACQLDTGEADRVEARGRDALARLGPHLRAGGYLTRATIRFDVVDEAHPVDAIVEVPNRLTIGVPDASAGGSRGARLAREALASLGVLSPGTMADDVTTLLPLLHPAWRWREVAGDRGLEAMRAAGVLQAVPGANVRRFANEAQRRVGRSAIAYRLYPDKVGAKESWPALDRAYYAVAEDWSIAARSVDVSAMDMLRLRLDAVVAKGAREMGLARGRKPKLPPGIVWVGDLRVESGVVRFFYVVRAATGEGDRERAAVGKAIARATGFGRAVALVPRGRRLGRDFVEIELDVLEQLGAASWRTKLAEAVAELGIEEEVPVELLVPEGVRLVVDRRRERAVLDGVPLGKLADSAHRLLLTLAARGDGSEIVPTRELDRILSGARGTEGATRTTAWKLKTWIEESHAEAGRDVPSDVRETGLVVAVGKKGWRLAVRGMVV